MLRFQINKLNKYLVAFGVVVLGLGLIDFIWWLLNFVKDGKHKASVKWIAAQPREKIAYAVLLVVLVIGGFRVLRLLKIVSHRRCPSCGNELDSNEQGSHCVLCGVGLNDKTSHIPAGFQRVEQGVSNAEKSRLARLKIVREIKSINSYFFKYELPFWFLLYITVQTLDKMGLLASMDVSSKAYFGLAIFFIPLVIRTVEESFWDSRGNCPVCSTKFPSGLPEGLGKTGFMFWHMHFPDFCRQCGCKLTDDTCKPDALVPFAKMCFRLGLAAWLMFSLK